MGQSGRNAVGAIGLTLLALGIWSPSARSEELRGPGAWLGVATRAISESWRKQNDYHSGGVMVMEVSPGGPAEMAGVEPGDVLVSVDTRVIRAPADVSEMESGLTPGQAVSAVIAREGGKAIKIFNVTPARAAGEQGAGAAEIPAPPLPGQQSSPAVAVAATTTAAVVTSPADAAGSADTPSSANPADARSELGLTCQDLSPELAEAMGTPDALGVLVLGVTDAGIAQRAGMKAGDVIFKVGATPITDVSALDAAVAAAPNKVQITTLRHHDARQVMIELPGHAAVDPNAPVAQTDVSSDAWRDQMLLQLRDELRLLRKEVQNLRDQLAHANQP
jgi:serine protease Do